jgi:hypothetical protein
MNQPWQISSRASPAAKKIADRHYTRQSPESVQFVPPGRCLVLWMPGALWVTSWPYPEFVRHAWPGAWICSLFRRESYCEHLASDLIMAAVAATKARWPVTPDLGMITFVDQDKVKRKRDPGRCFRKAGFRRVGQTKGGLIALQLLPEEMPEAMPASGTQTLLF